MKKHIIRFEKNNYIMKIILYLISILLFSIIYNFCQDNEFAGWVDTTSKSLLEEDKYMAYIFQKYSNKKNYINLNNFLKIPIYKKDNEWFVLEKENYITNNYKNKEEKYKLFNKLKNYNNLLNENEFLGVSISIENINTNNIPYDINFPINFKTPKASAVNSYFDRLYFSCISQSLLGYGDIFPISNRTRIIVIFQSVISIGIFFIP
mgnify:CR=1 FL=1